MSLRVAFVLTCLTVLIGCEDCRMTSSVVYEIADGAEDRIAGLRRAAEASIPADMGVISDRKAPIFFASLGRSERIIMKFMVEGDCDTSTQKAESWLAEHLPASEYASFVASTHVRCEEQADLYFNEDSKGLNVIVLREAEEPVHE